MQSAVRAYALVACPDLCSDWGAVQCLVLLLVSTVVPGEQERSYSKIPSTSWHQQPIAGLCCVFVGRMMEFETQDMSAIYFWIQSTQDSVTSFFGLSYVH